MKRNTLVAAAVLSILAFFVWAGWASFESRKPAATATEKSASSATAPNEAASGSAATASGPAADLEPTAAQLLEKQAPPFTLEDLSGRKVALARYKGKALMLNFWATWCGPCKIETPWLVELRDQYANQGFEVLGISVDDLDQGNAEIFADQKREIARYVQEMRMPYPVLIDGDSISQPYGGLDELPTSFFLNRKGVVVAMQVGVTSKSEIASNIRKALGM